MVKIVAIVPARMNSSRFPGKPLASILGRPMIEHVVRRALMCEQLDSVYVATCDQEIKNVVEGFGGSVIMTSAAHERASDRVAEAAEQAAPSDIVVMIQGDEPMITPEMIAVALAPLLRDSSVDCVNLARRIENPQEYFDPNIIKVVMNIHSDALYFSRNPIPAIDSTQINLLPVFKQVCVIPFRRAFLRKFASLSPTPLEQAESIDMLRAVESGYRVRLIETKINTRAVDTPDDLRLVEQLMKNEPPIAKYEKKLWLPEENR